MLPMPIISNTNIQEKEFIPPQMVTYRGDANLSTWRTAILNSEYWFMDWRNTELKFMPSSYYTIRLASSLGKRLFCRVKFNSFNSAKIEASSGTSMFKFDLVKNAWNTIEVQFGATATSTHTWIINGVQRYSGTKLSPVFLHFNAIITNNLVEFDIGNKGGTLPANCEWWS